MAMTVGYKRAIIQVLDDKGLAVPEKKHIIEGKAGKGGTTEAKISGISPDSIKVFASNVAYYVSAKGTGDVKADLSMLDIPNECLEDVLGRTKHTDGFTLVGERTQAPYVAVTLESEDVNGEPVIFALLKGKMSIGDTSLKTNEDKPAEPEQEVLSMECIANSEGETVAYGFGSEIKTKIEKYAFPAAIG